MITWLVENWRDCWQEMRPLWPLHYREIAIHQDSIPLDPDLPEYMRMADSGSLCVVVGRQAGTIVGYHLSIIRPHLHYRSTLHAFTDIYYLAPELRGNREGAAMIEAVKLAWRERGVTKGFSAYKKDHPLGRLFAATGWEETETVVTILIKG